MRAIEFTAMIKNGMIEVPQQYRELINKLARVIILTPEEKQEEPKQDKESIQLILKQLKDQNAFSSIDDPVKWQKGIRDEWE